jgi:hypothetical protein
MNESPICNYLSKETLIIWVRPRRQWFNLHYGSIPY